MIHYNSGVVIYISDRRDHAFLKSIKTSIDTLRGYFSQKSINIFVK